MNHPLFFGFLVSACVVAVATAGPYTEPGIPGFVGGELNPAFVGWASASLDYAPAPGVAAAWQSPHKALGPVTGNNADVVSLGDLNQDQITQGLAPGRITLHLDVPIADGTGPDFAVFENAALTGSALFAELAYVEVSSDGNTFARFPSVSLTPSPVGGYGTIDPTGVYNLAGKHPNTAGTSFGTPFDLAELATDAAVLSGNLDLNDVRYVRIVDIPGSGDFKDSLGNPIYDAWVTWGSGGFDLDAIGVLNAASQPGNLPVTCAAGYRAGLRFGSGNNLRGPEVIDLMGNELVFFEGFYGLEIADPVSETIVASYGKPADGYMVPDGNGFVPWVSFVEVEPGKEAIWVGFTTMGNTDDRIYRFDLSEETWAHKATMAGNFDLEFYGGVPYVSGLNEPGWTAPNSIWKLDVSGANEHDRVIEIGGNSAGFAVSESEGFFYVNYSTTAGESSLWRWDAAAVEAAIGEGRLTKAEGTLLCELTGGGYDTEVDAEGNIVFSSNTSGEGRLFVWPKTNSPGQTPAEIASMTGEIWLSFLVVSGDITAEGTAYFVDYYTPGVYEIIAKRKPMLLDGDLNADGSVDSGDLDVVRGNWGRTVAPGDASEGDATGDGLVDSNDLDVIRGNWGAVAAAVPEPSALLLGAFGLLMGAFQRRNVAGRLPR